MDSEVKEIAREVEEEVKEIASEAKEATDWAIQVIVLVLCAGFLGVALSAQKAPEPSMSASNIRFLISSMEAGSNQHPWYPSPPFHRPFGHRLTTYDWVST